MPKILCLTHHDLDAPAYGAALRVRHLCQLLRRYGDVEVVRAGSQKFWDDRPQASFGGFRLLRSVEFLPTPKLTLSEKWRHDLDPRWVNTNGFQASATDRAWLNNVMSAHEFVWVFDLVVANGFGCWRWPKAILDIGDIPSQVYRTKLARAENPWQKLRILRQVLLWSRHERRLHERFAALCVCSEADKDIMGGSAKFHVLPNGFEAPQGNPIRQPVTPPRLGFIGTFGYAPNRDGVRWFVENAWPLVLERFPAARLRLVGSGSESENFVGVPNIDALGFVKDVATEMATWSLSIVPVLVGGGTRIKIAESFSRKCPVVSTRLGAYGYDVLNGRELWLADTASTFAEQCVRVLADPVAAATLAECAWQRFTAQWTWDAQAEKIQRLVAAVRADS